MSPLGHPEPVPTVYLLLRMRPSRVAKASDRRLSRSNVESCSNCTLINTCFEEPRKEPNCTCPKVGLSCETPLFSPTNSPLLLVSSMVGQSNVAPVEVVRMRQFSRMRP